MELGRRGLRLGILVYRISAFLLTGALAAVVELRRPALTWFALSLLGGWIAGVTWIKGWDRRWVRWVDLALSAGLLLVAPLFASEGSLATHPFFAAAYPMATIATWAATTGLMASLAVAVTLFIPLGLSRPLNGLSYEELPLGEDISVVSGAVYYAIAAITISFFSSALDRAARELQGAHEEAVRQSEYAARMREREALAREIHDSVLQSMALLHRRGQEMAGMPQVPGRAVHELVSIIDGEERSLRELLSRVPQDAPDGSIPLRTVLQAAAYGIGGVRVSVSTVDPVWIAAHEAAEVSAAVRQALENVARHARASNATVFGEREADDIVIVVRDDGVGFDFDEGRLAEEGRMGILHGMRGRIEGCGGTLRIRSAPGRGTEVEFRLPASGTP